MTPPPKPTSSFPWLILPPAGVLIVLFGVPLLLVLAVSFASRGTYGGVEWALTFANYTSIADPLYLRIFWRSLWLAVATTAICLVMGFPLAYVIARAPKRWQGLLLFLVIIPFWTNFLVRTYAWMFILRTEGLLNQALLSAGLIHEPLNILFTDWAVLIGLVYGYLPFMVLPLYAALERLDRSLVEAAWDLYARPVQVFTKVVLPLSRPGVIAGCVLVFIPSLGAYVTPDLLGGARTMMVGNLIQHQYLVVRDWPFGSALSFVLMAGVLAAVLYYLRAGGARSLT
ncbi:MAG: ABC transporter permease [Nitrospirae bacterium]|nr:MAG: ABC transporter permease [Nitrospirota bacterium]